MTFRDFYEADKVNLRKECDSYMVFVFDIALQKNYVKLEEAINSELYWDYEYLNDRQDGTNGKVTIYLRKPAV